MHWIIPYPTSASTAWFVVLSMATVAGRVWRGFRLGSDFQAKLVPIALNESRNDGTSPSEHANCIDYVVVSMFAVPTGDMMLNVAVRQWVMPAPECGSTEVSAPASMRLKCGVIKPLTACGSMTG